MPVWKKLVLGQVLVRGVPAPGAWDTACCQSWAIKLAGQLLSSCLGNFQSKCLCKITGELRGKRKLLCILG